MAFLFGAIAMLSIGLYAMRMVASSSDYEPKQTQSSFESLLKTGMSESKVVDQLGPPTSTYEFERPPGHVLGDIWYFGRDFGIEQLTFENDELRVYKSIPQPEMPNHYLSWIISPRSRV